MWDSLKKAVEESKYPILLAKGLLPTVSLPENSANPWHLKGKRDFRGTVTKQELNLYMHYFSQPNLQMPSIKSTRLISLQLLKRQGWFNESLAFTARQFCVVIPLSFSVYFIRRIPHRPVVFLKSFAYIAAAAALGPRSWCWRTSGARGCSRGGRSRLCPLRRARRGPLRAQESEEPGSTRGAAVPHLQLGAHREQPRPPPLPPHAAPAPRPAAKPQPQSLHSDAERITGREFGKCLRSPEPPCPPAASPRSPRRR